MRANEVVEKLVQSIEAGVLPWTRPWASSTSSCLPMNPITKRSYSGSNVLLLWSAQINYKYDSALWLGFDQAKKMGGNVRKGERGSHILIYRNGVRESDDGTEEAYAFMSVKAVFNLDQIDGLDHLKPTYEKREWNPIENAEALIKKSGAMIHYKGERSSYNKNKDEINLPDRDRFSNPDDF